MKDLRYLFSNGCSFGGDRGSANTNVGKELSNKLNLEHINFSAGGRGNDRIVSTTRSWFAKNKSRIIPFLDI